MKTEKETKENMTREELTVWILSNYLHEVENNLTIGNYTKALETAELITWKIEKLIKGE